MRGYIKSPCRDCPDRCVDLNTNCHSYCEKYLAYQETNSIAIGKEIEGRKVAAEIKRLKIKSCVATVRRKNSRG